MVVLHKMTLGVHRAQNIDLFKHLFIEGRRNVSHRLEVSVKCYNMLVLPGGDVGDFWKACHTRKASHSAQKPSTHQVSH